MTKENLQDLIVASLAEIKGMDIRTLDVRELTSVFDFMVVASGASTRQVKALADNVAKQAKQAGFRPISSEGHESADWILIDFGDISVHIMLPEAREFYDLEGLWACSAYSQPGLADDQ